MTKLIITVLLFSTLSWGQVQNPDTPARGTWNFKAEKQWTVDNYQGTPLAETQNIVLGNDGRTYVLDAQLQKIFILDSEGKTIKTFGKKGEGPGEIRVFRSGQQLFLLGDRLLYRDAGRIHYFTLDGQYQRSAVFSDTLRPAAFTSLDSFISAPSRITDEKNKTSPIKLVDIKSSTDKTIAVYRPFAKATDTGESGGQRMTITIVIGGVTPQMTVFYKNNKMYYGMSDSYNISITDLEGKSQGGFSVEGRKPQKLNEKFFTDLKAALGDVPADMLKKILDSLPRRAAYFQSFYVGNNGLIYVVLSNPNDAHLIRMDIFSPEGKYLYRGSLGIDKSLSINNMTFNNHYLVMDYQNEEGDLFLEKYAMTLPEK